ncbi:MAG: hypothetical protein OEY89_11450 [Gammaproteobacteria bacterium]|nr:hypothetical protein [Gammaproteobacteria bacterium]
MKNSTLKLSLLALGISMATTASAASKTDTGPLTVVNATSLVDGSIGGFICDDGAFSATGECNIKSIVYPIAGDIKAPVVDVKTGETIASLTKIAHIQANAVFDVSFFGLATTPMQDLGASLPWTFDNNNFKVTFDNGSVFELIPEIPHTGRAFTGLGPVLDPATTGGTLDLRMGGCAGVRETSGTGPYANKVGSFCLNGTFTFDSAFNGVGRSNCTLVLHDSTI